MMNNLDSLFAPKLESFNEKKGTLEYYKPSPDKGKGGIYKSIIRFVSWHENPSKSIIEKWTCWLKDPITNAVKSVDCPSSVGKPSPIQDMYWKLKNSKSAIEQDLANSFSRSNSIYALIQVIKDDNDPSLNGKILIWKFGKKVFEKLNAEEKPMIGEGINPFSPIEGRAFGLYITKVSNYANYDQSNFLGERGACPIMWDIEQANTFTNMSYNAPKTVNMVNLIKDEYSKGASFSKMIDNLFASHNQQVNIDMLDDSTTVKLAIYAYLSNKSPNLAQCAYKEWDTETIEYVNEVIRHATNGNIALGTANVINHTNNNVNNTSSYQSQAINMPQQPMNISAQNVQTNTSSMAQQLPPTGGVNVDLDLNALIGELGIGNL